MDLDPYMYGLLAMVVMSTMTAIVTTMLVVSTPSRSVRLPISASMHGTQRNVHRHSQLPLAMEERKESYDTNRSNRCVGLVAFVLCSDHYESEWQLYE